MTEKIGAAYSKSYKALKDTCWPDKGKMRQYIVDNLVNPILGDILGELEKEPGFTEKIWEDALAQIMPSTVEDLIQITIIRMWHEIANEGEYRKLATKRWFETKVVGFFSEAGVNLFLVGHIDKLYQLTDDSFCIRDKKTTSTVRLWGSKDGGYYGSELQLGGYKYLLQQLHGLKVSMLGEIELARYLERFA